MPPAGFCGAKYREAELMFPEVRIFPILLLCPVLQNASEEAHDNPANTKLNQELNFMRRYD